MPQYHFNGNKMQREEAAKKHTELMEELYGDSISQCIKDTRIYSGVSKREYKDISDVNVKMSLVKTDSVSALFDCKESGKVAILNFASYRYPGGGFIKGSRAQEEALCQESFLYNVIKDFECNYYIENRNSLNNGLYRNRALYSPNIRFMRGDTTKTCDVISCAAPNFSVARNSVSREVNNNALSERVRFILETIKEEQVEVFIAGAFGCGVFQQDPQVLAQCFCNEAQRVFYNRPIHLIFAIPEIPGKLNNIIPFETMVKKWNAKSSAD